MLKVVRNWSRSEANAKAAADGVDLSPKRTQPYLYAIWIY